MPGCNEIFHNILDFDLAIYNILDFDMGIFPSQRDGKFSSDERFNGTSPSVAKHVIIECKEYKVERKNLDSEMIKRIGNREWEEINQIENKGMKEILGLGDYGQKTTDNKEIFKYYLEKEKIDQQGTEKYLGK